MNDRMRGPPGTMYGQCSFYGYGLQSPNLCYHYYEVMSDNGGAFSAKCPACQHFAPR